MHKDFSDDAWEDYTYWVIHDKKILNLHSLHEARLNLRLPLS
nr:type II toxin-antitoxin system YoeB family toxin [Treponema denticola]